MSERESQRIVRIAALRRKICARLGLTPQASNEEIFDAIDAIPKKKPATSASPTMDELAALAGWGSAAAKQQKKPDGLTAAERELHERAFGRR